MTAISDIKPTYRLCIHTLLTAVYNPMYSVNIRDKGCNNIVAVDCRDKAHADRLMQELHDAGFHRLGDMYTDAVDPKIL